MRFELKKGLFSGAADTMGGELVSFRDGDGTEYLWQGDAAYWTGRNPILFPIVGGLRGGRVRFGDRECGMPRHGFARRSEFTAAQRGEDFITFELRENEATLGQYPFPFLLRVTHRLTETGFRTGFEVRNTGNRPMPFCIGAHTAFFCPLRGGERFEDYRLVFEKREEAGTLLLNGEGCIAHGRREEVMAGTDTIELDHAVFDRLDTLIFDGLASREVRLVHRGTGHGVRMEFGDFPMVAFWTKPGARAPYICLEPWQGCAAWDNESGQFTDKPHRVLLQPGESRRLGYGVDVI